MNQPIQNSAAAGPVAHPAVPPKKRGQRVMPLPLALVATALPFLTAWSADGGDRGGVEETLIRGSRAEARPLDEPFRRLSRDVRLPEAPGGYVDVWAQPKGWEVGTLLRAGKR